MKSILLILLCLSFGLNAGAMNQPLNQPLNQPQARAQLQKIQVTANATNLLLYAAAGDTAMVQLLVKAGVDINSTGTVFQETALHNAAANGHIKMLQWLLKNGANPQSEDKNAATPLIWAAYFGRDKAMQQLLNHKVAINIVPKQGPTALVAAIQSGSLASVKLLLQHKADKHLATIDGITPAQAAEMRQDKKVMEMINE